MEYYTYVLIDPRNNKIFYIGAGQKKRMYDHVDAVKKNRIPNHTNKKLGNKIKKILSLGLKIKYEKILITKIRQNAFDKEKVLISEIGLASLCNLTVGGINPVMCGKNNPMFGKTGKLHHRFGKKHTEETIKKLSEAKKGQNHPMFGKKHSDETIKKLSGKNNPMFKKTHSKEARLKISNSQKGSGNSQYGTCWITKNSLNKKIKKNDLSMFINQNWLKGRTIN